MLLFFFAEALACRLRGQDAAASDSSWDVVPLCLAWRVELDFSPDGYRDDAAAMDAASAYGARYGLEAELVERVGPGGGCPVYAFIGSRRGIKRLCLAHVAGHDVAEGRRFAQVCELREAAHLLRGAVRVRVAP